MATAPRRGIVLRLSTEGTEQVKTALKALGAEGEAALRQLERGAAGVTPQLRALDATTKTLGQSVRGEFQRLSTGIVGMISPVNLLIGAFGTLVGAVIASFSQAEEEVESLDDLIAAHADTVGLIEEAYKAASEGLADYAAESIEVYTTALAFQTDQLQEALNKARDELYRETLVAGGLVDDTLEPVFDQIMRLASDSGVSIAALREEVGQLRTAFPEDAITQAAGKFLELTQALFNSEQEIERNNESLRQAAEILAGTAGATERTTATINDAIAANERLAKARGLSTDAAREEAEVQEVLARQSAERIAALLQEEALKAGSAVNAIIAEAYNDPALTEAAVALSEPVLALFDSIRAGTPDVTAFRAAIATFANLDPENSGLQTFVANLIAVTNLAQSLQAGLNPAEPPARSGGGGAAAAAAAEQRRLEQLARTVLEDVNPALAARIDLEERLSDLAAIRAADLLTEADYTLAVAAANRDYAEALAEARREQEKLDGSLRAGGIRALRSLADEAKDAGGTIESALTSAFKAAQSAFDDFLDGGEDSFHKFVLAILKDLARLNFAQGLAQLAKGVLGGLTGGVATGAPLDLTAALQFHGGGMGYEPAPTRFVDARMVPAAPRFHGGVGPDEMLSVIRRNEGVFTPGQMRALGQGAVVQVFNNSGGRVRKQRSRTPDGRELIRLFIGAVAEDIGAGGPAAAAIGQALREGLIR